MTIKPTQNVEIRVQGLQIIWTVKGTQIRIAGFGTVGTVALVTTGFTIVTLLPVVSVASAAIVVNKVNMAVEDTKYGIVIVNNSTAEGYCNESHYSSYRSYSTNYNT